VSRYSGATVRFRAIVLSALACGGLLLLTSWYFELSLSQVALLAPVVVVASGAVAGLGVLWARMALDPLRRRRRPG